MPDWFIWANSADLGHAILVAREAAGWSQTELGRRAGLNRKLVYRLENGVGSVRVDKVMQILAALGLMPLIVSAEAAAVLR
ncbi:MAG: helix-turn-helix domain-containing protein [Betaproteobacteria bacterium]